MKSDYAVIQVNNRQFMVSEGDVLKLDTINKETKVSILLTNINGKLIIGRPIIENMGIELEIIEQKKDKKVNVSRFRNKSRYRRTKGFRQPVTMVKVISIKEGAKTVINIKKSDESEKGQIENTQDIKVGKKETKKLASELDNSNKNVNKLGLSSRIVEELNKAGYKTVNDLKKAKKEDLLQIKGFGEKAVDKVIKEIN